MVDCPPLLGVAETILIAAQVDLVLIVVDAHRFDADQLEEALLRLRAAGIVQVGVIVNRVRSGKRRKRNLYGYGYDKWAEPDLEPVDEKLESSARVPANKAVGPRRASRT